MYRFRQYLAAVAAQARLASGAASSGWTRPNTSQAQIDQDASECTTQADLMTMSAARSDSSALTGGTRTTVNSSGIAATTTGAAPGTKTLSFGDSQAAFSNCMAARKYTRGAS